MVVPAAPGSHGGGDARTREAEVQDFVARAGAIRRRDELDRAAVVALTEFESMGVEAVLLKGPALARRLYRLGETRHYSDVDLLVRPRDLGPAEEALTRLGYLKAEEVLGIDDVAGVLHSEVWARAGEDGGPLLIDLHWRLDGCEAPDDVVWEALVDGRGSVELAGKRAAILGDEGLALHLALHAAQHGPGDAKALADLTRGIERWPPDLWRGAAQRAETAQATAALAAGLRLLPAGAELASALGLPPAPELEWKIQHRDVRPRGTFHLRAMAEAGGLRERANVIRRSLFPTPRWIRREYSWAARSRALLPLAYARHMLRAPLWAARAGRFLSRARRAGERR